MLLPGLLGPGMSRCTYLFLVPPNTSRNGVSSPRLFTNYGPAGMP